ncbi:hypothetical protein [Moritella sp. F3]|uniref:hypothetical protein n=1 Tax=Moritella sp. F3 TaxID=2718882 RepID=UPI0018E1062A|nr:hypothetical protein [Moritella sp. F3]GIC77069.1 hypothetical protein FMO001_17960 [Moritella sp. F1]GIC82188.1 hypothetical protein FMO003_24690 [Moritella sp. F3]
MQIPKLAPRSLILLSLAASVAVGGAHAAPVPSIEPSTSSKQSSNQGRSEYISSELQRTIESAGSAKEVYRSIETLTALDKIQAKNWGVTESDWVKYKTIMATTPRGNWSPNLDPIVTLGTEAKTEEERTRFAKLLYDTEIERQDKEIDFNYAVVKYHCRVAPQSNLCKTSEQLRRETLIEAEKQIAQAEINERTPRKLDNWSPIRYSLFVDVSTPCDASCKQYLSDTTSTLPYLDITISNAGKSGMQEFIERYKISQHDLNVENVTVTRGFRPEYLTEALPVVYKVIDGAIWGRVERREVQ